jgi:hypothetical protein
MGARLVSTSSKSAGSKDGCGDGDSDGDDDWESTGVVRRALRFGDVPLLRTCSYDTVEEEVVSNLLVGAGWHLKSVLHQPPKVIPNLSPPLRTPRG